MQNEVKLHRLSQLVIHIHNVVQYVFESLFIHLCYPSHAFRSLIVNELYYTLLVIEHNLQRINARFGVTVSSVV